MPGMAFLIGQPTILIRIRFSLFCFWILIPPLPCSISSITAPFPRSFSLFLRRLQEHGTVRPPHAITPTHAHPALAVPCISNQNSLILLPTKSISPISLAAGTYLFICAYHDHALRKCLTEGQPVPQWSTSIGRPYRRLLIQETKYVLVAMPLSKDNLVRGSRPLE
jgi:hypothetical protein